MPTEVLTKIMQYAIPQILAINAFYAKKTWKQDEPFKWAPWPLPGLLLVSKRIGRIARKIFCERVKFRIYIQSAVNDGLFHTSRHLGADIPADVKTKLREHFEAVFEGCIDRASCLKLY
jgi:hypothetical protein